VSATPKFSTSFRGPCSRPKLSSSAADRVELRKPGKRWHADRSDHSSATKVPLRCIRPAYAERRYRRLLSRWLPVWLPEISLATLMFECSRPTELSIRDSGRRPRVATGLTHHARLRQRLLPAQLPECLDAAYWTSRDPDQSAHPACDAVFARRQPNAPRPSCRPVRALRFTSHAEAATPDHA
jgi:hypothetical protein